MHFGKKNRNDIELFGLHSRDLLHHSALVAGLLFFFIVLITVNQHFQKFLVGTTAAFFYLAWGIAHHWSDGDIQFKNVIEYVVIALLAILILGGIYL